MFPWHKFIEMDHWKCNYLCQINFQMDCISFYWTDTVQYIKHPLPWLLNINFSHVQFDKWKNIFIFISLHIVCPLAIGFSSLWATGLWLVSIFPMRPHGKLIPPQSCLYMDLYELTQIRPMDLMMCECLSEIRFLSLNGPTEVWALWEAPGKQHGSQAPLWHSSHSYLFLAHPIFCFHLSYGLPWWLRW